MTDCGTAEMKELTWSWKLIKRHLSPDNMLFEDGDNYCSLSQKYLPFDTIDTAGLVRVKEFVCGISSCCQTFDTLIKYETHYNSSHRHVCHICQRMFPSSHLLEVHVLESHDVMFSLLSEKYNMFQCLLVDCPLKFKTSKDRKNHMTTAHRYPTNYRYDKSANSRSKKRVADSVRITESEGKDIEEDMDGDITSTASGAEINSGLQIKTRTFLHKVPGHISFGQGIPRVFLSTRGMGRRNQQKKQCDRSSRTDTRVHIETVSMKDLSDALL